MTMARRISDFDGTHIATVQVESYVPPAERRRLDAADHRGGFNGISLRRAEAWLSRPQHADESIRQYLAAAVARGLPGLPADAIAAMSIDQLRRVYEHDLIDPPGVRSDAASTESSTMTRFDSAEKNAIARLREILTEAERGKLKSQAAKEAARLLQTLAELSEATPREDEPRADSDDIAERARLAREQRNRDRWRQPAPAPGTPTPRSDSGDGPVSVEEARRRRAERNANRWRQPGGYDPNGGAAA